MAEKFTTTMGVLQGVTELNNRFECNKSEEEPYPTYPCMFWVNPATGILKQRNVTNDGWVTLYSLASGVTALFDALYPIGTVYENAITSANPATYLGFGTWEPFGQGRVTVGVDSSQSEFNSVQKTGGAKTHTLTINEMPSHTHQYRQFKSGDDWGQSPGNWDNRGTTYWTTESTGGGQPHNNLQPYITVYRWLRVA